MMLPMSLPQSCARIGAGFLSEKCVSASCRCNGHEAMARLSNQHASGVCSPEFALRQRTLQQNASTTARLLQHQSLSLRMGDVANGTFLFVQQKRVALRFPPLSWRSALGTSGLNNRYVH